MNTDKILQAYVGRTQISTLNLKVLLPWAKGAQNNGEKNGSFL